MTKTIGLFLFLSCTLLNASIVPTFIDLAGIEAPNGVSNTLPVKLQRGVNRVFVPFDIPDARSISLLSSIKVTVTVQDDDDSGEASTDEAGFFAFALGGFGTGPIPIGFFDELDGTSQTFSASITDPLALLYALFEMQDNNRFQIRVDRCCGDFIVQAVDVEVHAAPEPSTFALFGGGILFSALWLRRRQKPGLVPEVSHAGKHHRQP